MSYTTLAACELKLKKQLKRAIYQPLPLLPFNYATSIAAAYLHAIFRLTNRVQTRLQAASEPCACSCSAPRRGLVTPPRRRQPTLCQAKKKEKKGFDYKPPPKPPAKKAITDDVGVAAATTPEGNSQLLQTLLAEEKDRAQVQTEAMEDLKERDAYVAEKGVEAARVPDAVANRMIMRMATFGGVPVFLGIGVFVWFYFQAPMRTTSSSRRPAQRRQCPGCWGCWGGRRAVGVLGRGGRTQSAGCGRGR